jgi:hypothetical protein
MPLSARSIRLALLALLAVGIIGASTGALHAAFTSSTSNPASAFASKKIFPRDRVSSAWAVSDQADSSAADQSGPTAYADGRIDTTGNWSTAFAANRYLDFEPSSLLPGALAVSSPVYQIRFSSSAAGTTVCMYFEVIRRSTSAVLATYGSAGSPAGCVTGTAYQTFSTPIPIVTTTDIANDLRIRVYGRHTGSGAMRLDRSVVTGSTPYTAFTLYSEHYNDAADTTGQLISWGLPRSGDGINYPSQGNWTNVFAANRYIRLTFEPFVPAGAVVSSAGFTHSYRSMSAGKTVCWYFETYNGAALLAAHGSAGSPISCVTGNAAWQTDTVSIPEVNTVAEANNLVIRIYANVSGGTPRRSEHDRAVVTLNYYLD